MKKTYSYLAIFSITIFILLILSNRSFNEVKKNINNASVDLENTSNRFLDLVHSGDLDVNKFRNKVLVLNFWATWCSPCLKEIPELNELSNKHKNGDIAFIAITGWLLELGGAWFQVK